MPGWQRVDRGGLCCVTLVKLGVTFPRVTFVCASKIYLVKRGTHVKFRMQKWDGSLWSLMTILLSNMVTDGCRDVQLFPDETYSLLLNVQLFFQTLGPADHLRCLTVDPQTWQQLLIGLAVNSPFPAPSAAVCWAFQNDLKNWWCLLYPQTFCSFSKNVGSVFP